MVHFTGAVLGPVLVAVMIFQLHGRGFVKQSQLVRGTHSPSSAERGTRQDSKGMPESEGYSQTVEGMAKDFLVKHRGK
jgi:hypothetical protein